MEAELANSEREHALEGIGGWLILPAIGLPLTALVHLWLVVSQILLAARPDYKALASVYAGLPALQWFDFLTNLVVLGLLCLACYYFFTRKNDTPPVVICAVAATVLFHIVAFVWACFVLPLRSVVGWPMVYLLRDLILGPIVVVYLLRSQRVRDTFREPSPKVFALAYRELGSYFISPVAYIVGAMFLLASGLWFFHAIFVPGHEASLRPLFEGMAYIMVFAVPLLTMRLISEEMRSGTMETLMTAPVTDTEVVLGKFLGVMGLYVALLACTGVFLALMGAYGQPDAGVAVMGYVGMLLLGSAYVAVGIFASTLTPYQLVAAIVSTAILAVFVILMQLVVAHGPEPWNLIAAKLNAMTYFKDFSRGMFDSRGLVFFLGAAVLFLFLSVKFLESRRWR